MFSSRVIWTTVCRSLALQATKAVFPVYRLFYKNRFLSFSTACNIFDGKVVPILLYASEIWGLKYYDCI